ncbi:imidazole glycerol phosphate synthase subunit HisH [Dethiosulfatarculus sandiegensis]|uniref:Imidazole glycerol phosphate synthase subunit HisH n=1 Tax=Dethiosulfatarculus sandiegensis TaxID=1429043 RepID=A0A0D2J921_9BACT|nr:imidazole glycerol phosphate synthase subunit HisH [Dethiosulfatarculus sandiegensis]KIX12221.1 imidazole glycerol phosphate synthase [Dethiosulfatarculus sandiegensis]
MLAIVDYKAGNLTSVERAVRHLGASCRITDDPGEVDRAERIIFPGVGAAAASMENLHRLGLDKALGRAVHQGKPVLGICVGCQIIFEHSEEGQTPCLGLIPGKVKRFDSSLLTKEQKPIKVPHMGWNQVTWRKSHPVFKGLQNQDQFYFVHSYYPVPQDPEHVLGTTEYGLTFASAVAKGSLAAVQFHAEKSGRAGLVILSNFLSWDGKEV